MGSDLLDAAVAYCRAGLCVLPARLREKRPALPGWAEYQGRLPTEGEMRGMFAGNSDALCIVCGAVSGNVECLDFDLGGEAFAAWAELVEGEAPGLLDRLVLERSPSGGCHVVYRCESAVAGNAKLAHRVIPADGRGPLTIGSKDYTPKRGPDGSWAVAVATIETRGEGGLFLCAPSPGYVLTRGDLAALPVLTADEREVLLRAARALDEAPRVDVVGRERSPTAASAAGLRPGDDYNARGDVREVLLRHGWTLTREGDNSHWARPGKTSGTSATLRDGVFYVFSSNAAPLVPGTPYSPFAVCAMLDHAGDFAAGAAALARDGYGSPAPSAPVAAVEDDRPPLPDYDPFPVDVLPEPLRVFVSAASAAVRCDAAYIALPLLAGLASAIGNTRRVELKRGYTEPAILWTAIVGESGTAKSPALEMALRPVRARQADAMRRYAEEMRDHADALARYEREHDRWRKGKGEGDPPAKPEAPTPERTWTDDATPEALAVLLQQNPRGLLMGRDELAGWFDFDRYASGKGGAAAARWLEMFGGRPMVVDRRGSGTTYVPRAAVSIAGAIQPAVLRDAMTNKHRESGFAARLLVAFPPRQPRRWSEEEVSPETEAALGRVFDRLYSLSPETDPDGHEHPRTLTLDLAAKRAFTRFYDDTADETLCLHGDEAAAWNKLAGYAARIALVCHLVRRAADDPDAAPDTIDEASMAAGIVLARWFGAEGRRAYRALDETHAGSDHSLRELEEMIRELGGSAGVSDLQRRSRRYRGNPSLAKADLDRLVESGRGSWYQPPQQGRGHPPAPRVVLEASTDPAVNAIAAQSPATGNCVDALTASTSQADAGGHAA